MVWCESNGMLGRNAATRQQRTARSIKQMHHRCLLPPSIGKHGAAALTGAQRWRAPCPGTPPAGRPGLAGWKGPAGEGGWVGGGIAHSSTPSWRVPCNRTRVAAWRGQHPSTPAPAPRPAAAPTSMFLTTRSVTHSQWRPAGGRRHWEGLKGMRTRGERCTGAHLRCWAQWAVAEGWARCRLGAGGGAGHGQLATC